MIAIPPRIAEGDLILVVSLSGGKDSTATALALKETGLPYRLVFADTGWEAPETYAHLDELERHLGPIAKVGHPDGMVGRIRHRAGFPARLQRWCTRELKVRPLRDWHDRLEAEEKAESVCVVGIRAEESARRAQMADFEDDEHWGGWMWRPILDWTVEEVLAIHHRHGVPLHPHYHRGHGRVGCWPCINASKEEIRLLADADPSRIDLIRSLEVEVRQERAARNASKPGRYEHHEGTFFQSRIDRSGTQPIDSVVEWARTDKGGRQLPLLPADPTGGCFRWGLCEPPKEEP